MKHYILIISLLISLLCGCSLLERDETEKENQWSYAYAENYVDSLDAIFSREGYAVLFGGCEMPLSESQTAIERVLYVVQTDFDNAKINEEDALLITIDSTYVPYQIIAPSGIIRIDFDENGDCSLIYKQGDNEDWIEIGNVNYKLSTKSSQTESLTKSLATGGVSKFTIANALKALDIINGIKGCLQSTSLKEFISNGVGVFGNFIPSDEAGVAAGLISSKLTSSLNSGLLSILSYAGSKIADGPLKYLGPVRLDIEDVTVLNTTSCKISYNVSGLHEYGMANSFLYFELYKDYKRIATLYLTPENGYASKVINGLNPGKYSVVLHIKSKKYHWEYTTYPEVFFTIFDLKLDHYEINDNPIYQDGSVKFGIDIYVKGDEESLKECSQYGYYISYSNKIDYYQITQLSSIFASTPSHCNLNIGKEEFDIMDYSSFNAEVTTYKIGTYIVDKAKGNITLMGEEKLDGLKYTERPALSFTGACINGTDIENDEDGQPSYCSTSFSANYTAQGTFWANTVDLVVTQGNAEDNVGFWEVVEDGDQSFSAYYTYPYGGGDSAFRFDLIIEGDQRISSTNSVLLSGSPTITNATVIGNTKAAISSKSHTRANHGAQYSKSLTGYK